MRAADYIFDYLAKQGITHVFMVSGGGAMHLDDALGRNEKLRYVCCLHEQACAIAAEGYARITNLPGAVCVTSGPGGTNAITGVTGAYLDSIPMIVISGQVKTSTLISACPGPKPRQLGDQELNIIDVVRPITKYARLLHSASEVPYELDKAFYLARSGRPGPVWLDVPLDVQSGEIDEKEAEKNRFIPGEDPLFEVDPEALDMEAEKLRSARRPVLVAGGGVRLAGAEAVLRELAEKCHLPVLTTISGVDLLSTDHPLNFGRPGIMGNRGANFILQNADHLLVVGARMGLRIVGYDWEDTGRGAFRTMVDADAAELEKPTFRPELKIRADAGAFLRALSEKLRNGLPEKPEHLAYCRKMREKYPATTRERRERTDYVSSYVFPELLSAKLPADAVVVTGNGTAYTSTFQSMPVKEGMRLFANQGCASMGYALPAAIGAAFAAEKSGRTVVALTGDGSIQMNIQELQTVRNYRLPVKIFVYNNEGYLSIKLTQRAFFKGRFVGSERFSGVILPELEKIAKAYGLPFFRLKNHSDCAEKLPEILALPGAALVEVMTDPFEELSPKSATRVMPDGRMVSAPLEDMAPFLDRKEFAENMVSVPPKEVF